MARVLSLWLCVSGVSVVGFGVGHGFVLICLAVLLVSRVFEEFG